MKRKSLNVKFGIYFAAIGAAFGLGSLWRFPFLAAENGGGAFVILYLFLMIILGLPLLVGELMIGKITRRGVLASQRQLVAHAQSRGVFKKRWIIQLLPVFAVTALFSAVMISGYYSVICGWVLYFLSQFLSALTTGSTDHISGSMDALRTSGGLQLGLTLIHIVLVCGFVAKGVEEGIEKWVGLLMPLFIGIVGVLVVQSLSLPSAQAALRFYLYPDFSKLHLSSLGSAIGQLCFTLSVGFATMVSFGSYLGDDTSVPKTGFRVAGLDTLAGIIAGFLIFPLVFEGATTVHGPELLFQTVPEFLYNLESGTVFGILFFLCLYMAALGASISIVETLVSNICENSRLSRNQAVFYAGIAIAIASLAPAFSSSFLREIQLNGRGLLEILDLALINWVIPVLALLSSQVVVYEISPQLLRDEFNTLGETERDILLVHWLFLLKWVAPPVIGLGLILQIIGLF